MKLLLETRRKRRRNDFDITAEILKVALYGAKKTHVVYKANLNFKILQEYLGRMSGADLITYTNGEIKTTDKGVAYLQQYSDFMKYLENPSKLFSAPTIHS